MKAAQVSKPGGNFEIVERPIPEPGRAQVRIKVEACGVCHSDAIVKESGFPGLQYPRVPGHEIAGRIDAVGADVTQWKPGPAGRRRLAWRTLLHLRSLPPRPFHSLPESRRLPGSATTAATRSMWWFRPRRSQPCPTNLAAEEAAPLLCAGITVFNSMRNAGATAGELVAVQGIGGLGHLGIQYARQMGFRTVAIGRGGDKEALAKKLGAHHYIDTEPLPMRPPPCRELGGAQMILATAPDSKAISSLVDGLGPDGKLRHRWRQHRSSHHHPLQLIFARRTVRGWPSGTAKDSEDTLQFSLLYGVRPMIERIRWKKSRKLTIR